MSILSEAWIELVTKIFNWPQGQICDGTILDDSLTYLAFNLTYAKDDLLVSLAWVSMLLPYESFRNFVGHLHYLFLQIIWFSYFKSCCFFQLHIGLKFVNLKMCDGVIWYLFVSLVHCATATLCFFNNALANSSSSINFLCSLQS